MVSKSLLPGEKGVTVGGVLHPADVDKPSPHLPSFIHSFILQHEA